MPLPFQAPSIAATPSVWCSSSAFRFDAPTPLSLDLVLLPIPRSWLPDRTARRGPGEMMRKGERKRMAGAGGSWEMVFAEGHARADVQGGVDGVPSKIVASIAELLSSCFSAGITPPLPCLKWKKGKMQQGGPAHLKLWITLYSIHNCTLHKFGAALLNLVRSLGGFNLLRTIVAIGIRCASFLTKWYLPGFSYCCMVCSVP